MKTVKYTHSSPVNLGRFGIVHKGQILHLTEHEWSGVSEDKRFYAMNEDYDEETLQKASVAMPYGTPFFDLRTLPWSYSNLFITLEARTNKHNLFKILSALEYVDAPVRKVSPHEPRTFVVDAIVECAILCGWTSLSKEELQQLPIFNPETRAKNVKAHAIVKDEPTDAVTSVRKRERQKPKKQKV